MKLDRRQWTIILGAAILALVVEFVIIHQKVFFIWYEPDIYPMSRVKCRLEALLYTPLFMFGNWWLTAPILGLGGVAIWKRRQLKGISNHTSDVIVASRAETSR